MKRGNRQGMRFARPLAVLLLMLLAFVGWAPSALAAPGCSAASATLSMPTSIVVQPNAAAGPVPGATGTATIIFTCSGLPASSNPVDRTATIQAGDTLAKLDSTNKTGGPGITFATNVTGLAILVTATPVQATSAACLLCGPGSTAGYVPGAVTAPSGAQVGSYSGSFTASYTAQLIKTTSAAITSGSIAQTNLIPFWWYISGGTTGSTSTSKSLGAMLILPAITITTPTCTVTAGNNQTVILPTVDTSQLASKGVTAGKTPFSIAISGCPSGFSSASNIFKGGAVDTGTGNLTNTTSSTGKNAKGAANVEVQLLNGANSSLTGALNLSKTTAASQNSGTFTVTNNAVTLNYFAQYYATGAAGAGAVTATVNYTITYQ